MDRTFHGRTKDEMKQVLYLFSDLEEEVDLNEEEQILYDLGIRCIASIIDQLDGESPLDEDYHSEDYDYD